MKLQKYKPQIASITTMQKCIGAQVPSLAKIRKESGEEDTLRILGKKIGQVNDFFNLQRKMSPEQTWITAKLILKEYYYLNIADMKIIFENMLSLKYGQYYGKIDGGDFLEAFRQYSEERLTLAEQLNQEKHQSTKEVESKSKGYGWHKTRQ